MSLAVIHFIGQATLQDICKATEVVAGLRARESRLEDIQKAQPLTCAFAGCFPYLGLWKHNRTQIR
jgi:hypothetical protein